jgi:hypothetical protein
MLKQHEIWINSTELRPNEPIKGKQANFIGLDLSEMNLACHDLRLAKFRGNTSSEICCLRDAELFHCTMSLLDLSGIDFSGANLSSCFMPRVNLRRSNLSGASLYNSCMDNSDFAYANLTGADLRYSGLRGSIFFKSILKEINLSCSFLSGAILESVKGKDILSFSFNKHHTYYYDGELQIGCITNRLDWWLRNYKEVGDNNGYSEQEISMYHEFMLMLNKNFDGSLEAKGEGAKE